MVQLALEHLFKLPPTEPLAAASVAPARRADETSFDKHLRQAGRDQQPSAESTTRPAGQQPPAAGDGATGVEAQQQTRRAAATQDDEPAATKADEQRPTTSASDEQAAGGADEEQVATRTGAERADQPADQTKGVGDDDRRSDDELALRAAAGVPQDLAATPVSDVLSEAPSGASAADAAVDQAAKLTRSAGAAEGATEETPTATDGARPAASAAGESASNGDEPETSHAPSGTLLATPDDAAAGVTTDQEATAAASKAAPNRGKGARRKGKTGKQDAAAAPTDAEPGVDATRRADAAAMAELKSVSDATRSGTDASHDGARLEPIGATGAESPAGPLRADSVTAAAAERLTQGQGVTKTEASETAPTARNTIDTARFVQRVSRAFLTGRVAAGREIRLRLHPPELGQLRLQIKVQDGALTAQMETDNHLAKTLLLDNLDALRSRLAEHDIKIDRFEVDLMQQPPNESPDHAADDARSEGRQVDPQRNVRPQALDDQQSTTVVRPRWTTGDGQLNIVV